MSTAPVLSTPAENLFEYTTPQKTTSRISDEQLYIQYEIQRTVREIRGHGWKRIALQFPDEMLCDAPRVSERLSGDLRRSRRRNRDSGKQDTGQKLEEGSEVDAVVDGVTKVDLAVNAGSDDKEGDGEKGEEKITILADTSYGACCVDEIAAEHVDAEVVVHYGRTCLSPTARLPVIYVFTTPSLDLDAAVESFKATYPSKTEKVCLMADVPYSHHVPPLAEALRTEGYSNIFATEIIHDPASLLPNRTIPSDVQTNGPEELQHHSIFHISHPPTSLLLVLTTRVKAIHIYPTSLTPPERTALEPATTLPLLRRRYALLTRVPSTPILGILINTLSVRNYLSALTHCKDLASAAGKKTYTFVVGKLNAAKLANFAEVGVWVVIGCWESSLVESRDFFAPVVTPFELEVALRGDGERRWGGEWVADFGALLGRAQADGGVEAAGVDRAGDQGNGIDDTTNTHDAEPPTEAGTSENWADAPSDEDEPPDFDLRTGRYVSHTRPMPRLAARPDPTLPSPPSASTPPTTTSGNAPPSSQLVQRPKAALASINGAVSPAAEFLREKRTWQGLGSDYEVQYERDEEGRIRGAVMEEGRRGVARGYGVGGRGEGN
ncbi:Diphthamide biosynthesis protein 2 [Saxophila tyrrhenica]|uniref:2-(3-amino-3-carboxypropyl)histidine synthase subunit 2 n=1 Tax=Saxophila tyrrhenica TaxID=1690608 RepID=A0AAV9P2R8_9PEZI|nr:Diphthamide biosynthesis protein 2 [Saxophila tyrrhenica]